jgi:hypothetical protein
MFSKKQSLISSDNCINANFKNFDAHYNVEITMKQEGEEDTTVSYNANAAIIVH